MTRDQNVTTRIHPDIARPARACFSFLPTLIFCWGVAVISATSYPIPASANMSEAEKAVLTTFTGMVDPSGAEQYAARLTTAR